MRHAPAAARVGIRTAILIAALSVAGCESDPAGPGGPGGPPDHTVVRDGAAHAPGLQAPAANCATCHGADLRGGANGEPSCFACHGRKWP